VPDGAPAETPGSDSSGVVTGVSLSAAAGADVVLAALSVAGSAVASGAADASVPVSAPPSAGALAALASDDPSATVGSLAAGASTGIGGRSVSGSTYPSSSAAIRTPRWTTPDAATVPTAWPSVTASPLWTPIDPSSVSVTLYEPLRIDTLNPLLGTVPAKVTLPDAGATTAVPGVAEISIPRCCPAAYGCASSNENASTTVPVTGQLQPPADGTTTSALRASAHAILLRMSPPLSEQ
jgi:hypothetical protein